MRGNAMTYGAWCLVPPIAMLVFAIKTKKSFEALIFGTLVAYIIMYGFGFKTNRQTLLSLAMAVGVGFALVENCYILINNLSAATIGWAVLRVLGASVMHGICTGIVGWGVSYVKTRRKLFYTGTFALLIMAIIAHGIFNSLIQSNIYILAVLCVLTATFCFAVAIKADRIKWKRS